MRIRLVSFIILALLASSAPGWPGEGPHQVKARDKCPVCGMFVARFRPWIAEVVFKDGSYRAFDGPKDMFRYLFDMERYEKDLTRKDIAGIWVTDYYSGKMVPAEKALFVTGSDVMGPMGAELVPVVGAEAAATFSRDHHGDAILKFSQVKPGTLPGHPNH